MCYCSINRSKLNDTFYPFKRILTLTRHNNQHSSNAIKLHNTLAQNCQKNDELEVKCFKFKGLEIWDIPTYIRNKCFLLKQKLQQIFKPQI